MLDIWWKQLANVGITLVAMGLFIKWLPPAASIPIVIAMATMLANWLPFMAGNPKTTVSKSKHPDAMPPGDDEK